MYRRHWLKRFWVRMRAFSIDRSIYLNMELVQFNCVQLLLVTNRLWYYFHRFFWLNMEFVAGLRESSVSFTSSIINDYQRGTCRVAVPGSSNGNKVYELISLYINIISLSPTLTTGDCWFFPSVAAELGVSFQKK